MSKTKIIGGIVLGIVIGVVAIGILSGGDNPQIPIVPDEPKNLPSNPDPDEQETPEEEAPKPVKVDRYEKIPASQVKMTTIVQFYIAFSGKTLLYWKEE